jgi:hypothetical protein
MSVVSADLRLSQPVFAKMGMQNARLEFTGYCGRILYMSVAAEKVAEVLAWPAQDRALLVCELIASLDNVVDPDAEAHWDEVIERHPAKSRKDRCNAALWRRPCGTFMPRSMRVVSHPEVQHYCSHRQPP